MILPYPRVCTIRSSWRRGQVAWLLRPALFFRLVVFKGVLMGWMDRAREGFATVRKEVSEINAAVRLDMNTPVPPAGTPLEECLAYLELVDLYVGLDRADVVLLDGSFDWTDAAALSEDANYGDGINTPLVALCRANLETHPELVRQIVDALLAPRRIEALRGTRRS